MYIIFFILYLYWLYFNIYIKDNIKQLEELSNGIQESIKQLKIIYENINKNKEKLKEEVQKIFTKIRNAINEKEDEVIFEIDKQCDEKYFKEELIKKAEKLPNKINLSLEIGKQIDKDLNDNNDNRLILQINDSMNIKNNMNIAKGFFKKKKYVFHSLRSLLKK